MVDWNNDGLLDILISAEYARDNGGAVVKLFINEGTATDYSFADSVNMTTSDGQDISLYERTNICVADMNYDGLLDLILGDGIGDYNSWNCNIYFFENTGTTTAPSLKAPVKLQNEDGTDIQIRYDLKPYVTDWNEDGGLDMLVGGLQEEDGIKIYLGEPHTAITDKNSVIPSNSIMKVYTNNNTFITQVSLNKTRQVRLNVVGINGRVFKSVDYGMIAAGNHRFEITHTDLTSGVYYINCLFDNKRFERKRVIIAK